MRFAFDAQIASQPEAVEAVLARPDQPLLDRSRPLLFTGSGTSLHACRVAASWAGYPAQAIEAHDLALRVAVPAGGQVVLVSHGGRGPFGAAVLAKARALSARTFAVVGEHAPQPWADVVLQTCPEERAETHSVSYLCALAVLGRMLGLELAEVSALLRKVLASPAPSEAALQLRACGALLVAGFGLDAIAADEAALKLKEATFKWAEGMAIEQALHGPQRALRAGMGAILLRPELEDGGRFEALREICEKRGLVIVEPSIPNCGDSLRPFLAALALQRLTAELARVCGGNPDG